MKVLFTGNGRAGSWFVRGEQIGQRLGTVNANAGPEDFRSHDLTVCVKRVPHTRLLSMRASGRPWVWDVVDAYPQPEAGAWSRRDAIRWLRQQLEALKPDAVIWPNARMREDAEFRGLQTVIYHHARPGLLANPIREHVQTVGYEGAPAYLDHWGPRLQSECRRRGWRFVVNPPALSQLDIVCALRGGQHAGYVQTHWKSNVKLANAHGSGTPFIGTRECGYVETASGAEVWAHTPGELSEAFDSLTPKHERERIHRTFLASAFPLNKTADHYRAFLCALKF